MERARILIADADPAAAEALCREVRAAGHEADLAGDVESLTTRVGTGAADLVLCAFDLPAAGGVAALRTSKTIRPSLPVVLYGPDPAVADVLAAFRAGAFDFLPEPLGGDVLGDLAGRALRIRVMGESRRRMSEEVERLRRRLADDDPFRDVVGRAGAFGALVDTIREVARTDSTVLLTGESGTGKSMVARAIHGASARARGPFVEANCVVYSEGVLQSELFGHERGAFTGAARTKRGRFELAAGGTLFLDEIGEIPPATQLLLLRVLHDRTFERVGGEETIGTDVRLIAATNRDLAVAIRAGAFRGDLYYRLNVIPIRLPALRERAEDVPLLAASFLTRCAARLDRDLDGFDDEAMGALMRYPWPGNVRELENVIERIAVLKRSGRIGLRDLPEPVRAGGSGAVGPRPGTLQELERARILDAMTETGGNKKLAAARLGIHRSTLYAKLRRYGLLDEDEPVEETADVFAAAGT